MQLNKPLFNKSLLSWYSENRRDLPWRKTNDPYTIWLSEIILQQTRIEQGLPYFFKLITRFPTVKSLATASEQEVLKLWQGLGYYSRARNMLYAAKQIMNEHGGRFPSESKQIRQLKGVGDYTTAAIGSFAFGHVLPVIDGNVKRFVTRFYGIKILPESSEGMRLIETLLNKLIDEKDPGTFNQAIMEFGSLQCTPRKPDCIACPLARACVANRENKQEEYPLKKVKKSKRERYFSYFFIRTKDSYFLQKRKEADIWQNMYELPVIETSKPSSLVRLKKLKSWGTLFQDQEIVVLKGKIKLTHILSHQRIHATFYSVEPNQRLKRTSKDWVKVKANHKMPVPRLIEIFINKMGLSGEKK